MEYLSKTYRLDEDVTAWLEELREAHGSVNKGLRSVMPTGAINLVRDASQPGESQSYRGVPTYRGIRPKGDTKR